jgi:hypothetical protein
MTGSPTQADALQAAAVGATLTMLTEEGVGPVAVELFLVGRDEFAVRDLGVVDGELQLGHVVQRVFHVQEVSDFLHNVDRTTLVDGVFMALILAISLIPYPLLTPGLSGVLPN